MMITQRSLWLAASLGLVAQAPAAVILSDDFQFGASNPANVNGSIANWTKTGSNLFNGIGTEDNAVYPTTSDWAYFQTNGSSSAGMFRSSGVNGATGDLLTLTFDFGGRTNSTYNGTFTVSLWDGSPTGGGTLLTSTVPANPAAGAISLITLQHTLTANTTGNIYVYFNAGVAGDANFRQPIIDNVSLSLTPIAVPEPSLALLGSLGAFGLLRRRRV